MTKLYAVLGIEKDAAPEAIGRAYRRLALQYHPDRNPDGGDMFKEITKAYEVLNDPARRSLYDLTHVVPGEDDGLTEQERNKQRGAELGVELKSFFETYRGSVEEAEDLAKAYRSTKGDFEAIIMEHALFDNVRGEVHRLHGILAKLVEDGALTASKKWARTSSDKAVTKYATELAAERKMAKRERAKMGLSSGAGAGKASATGKDNKPDMASLQVMLASRAKQQAAQWESMADNLLAKYGSTSGKKKKGQN
jgi:DnaJ family protein C protein 9